ncbi:urea transporter [Dactylosporangium sp. NBC_01737]|uniref:urea transporter n=1 Tax=Dactylosporangium sp. NBC_01737 TaxID=2975959 RepID=UPI002E143ECE|nr:urea transporter [Dactylosporangium sp. NBC_01737]
MDAISRTWSATADAHAPVRFADACLRGAAQVMLQNNPVTGLLILAAIGWGTIRTGTAEVGAGALVGLLAGTGTALLLRVDATSWRQGLFGFSPLLTGAALPTFLAAEPVLWAYVVLGAAVTTVVTLALSNVLNSWGVAALTFPFVLTSWFLLMGAYQFMRIGPGALSRPALPAATPAELAHVPVTFEFLATGTLKGIAQVFLLDDWVSGAVILVALAVNSRAVALAAILGSAVGTALAIGLGADGTAIGKGIWGFNAVLTALALGAVFYRPMPAVAVYTLLATITAVWVQAALTTVLAPYGIPTLTAPFVVATWLFLLPKRHFAPVPHHERHGDGTMLSTPAAPPRRS